MLDITNWEWPQYTFFVLWFLGLTVHAALNGKPLEGTYNFPLRLMGVLLAFTILLFGGFWA